MTQELQLDAELEFAAEAAGSESLDFDSEEFRQHAGTGFNEYGVRENYDSEGNIESVDVVFEAMEPGPPERRNGVRITDEFLRRVGGKDYTQEPPHLLDHRASETFANIGHVREVWFSEQAEKLALMVRVPNTGGPTHSEAIARYTYQPPAIRNGSVGFGKDYKAVRNDDGEPELVDGQLREFSTVNFPGGYDNGGVAAAFAEAATDAVSEFEGHDEGDEGSVDPEYRDEVYEQWSSLVNMTNEEMEMWDDHPCADAEVDDGENTRDETLMLMGQPPEGWGMESVEIANQVIDYLASETEDGMPDDAAEGGPGTCPSRWAVNLLNRGHNPFDGFPTGNPQFGELSAEVETLGFDDEAHDTSAEDDASENSAAESTSEFSVKTETLNF
ncbi:prohead protease [Halorubrum virus HRTV-11]|uniref:Prohead protease n=1 Tax=Halorubrum sodomense tailed virus 2 TaxID=1262527 RepID=L7TGJ3_9CAUD|nr:hypothetical protein HSTV2_10 [Halorubrum sodomense tailed virus 2]AGC34279.1 hypothetical protein HSTV2_10 [Halorubrum sodomense tailed virus 2]UBF22158.1 prohead protease [Halorubrum virus HRTV-2]UBF22267.1 prohead protease [Halorubrum virus HRTV-11]